MRLVGLTEQEKAMLDRLSKKANEPDPPPVGKSVTAHINLGNKDEVELAIKHGFLTADEAADLGNEGTGDDGGKGEEGDEKPKRRGYFPDN